MSWKFFIHTCFLVFCWNVFLWYFFNIRFCFSANISADFVSFIFFQCFCNFLAAYTSWFSEEIGLIPGVGLLAMRLWIDNTISLVNNKLINNPIDPAAFTPADTATTYLTPLQTSFYPPLYSTRPADQPHINFIGCSLRPSSLTIPPPIPLFTTTTHTWWQDVYILFNEFWTYYLIHLILFIISICRLYVLFFFILRSTLPLIWPTMIGWPNLQVCCMTSNNDKSYKHITTQPHPNSHSNSHYKSHYNHIPIQITIDITITIQFRLQSRSQIDYNWIPNPAQITFQFSNNSFHRSFHRFRNVFMSVFFVYVCFMLLLTESSWITKNKFCCKSSLFTVVSGFLFKYFSMIFFQHLFLFFCQHFCRVCFLNVFPIFFAAYTSWFTEEIGLIPGVGLLAMRLWIENTIL